MAFGTMDRLVIMMVPMTAIICTALVLILRPLTKQLGQVLTELQSQRGMRASDPERDRLEARLAHLEERLHNVEQGTTFDRALYGSNANPET